MNSQPKLGEPAASPSLKNNRRTSLKTALIALGVLLLVIVSFFTDSAPSGDKVVWLTPAQLARINQRGPLTRAKDRLMHWTAPLWKFYWRSRPQILIDSSLLTLSAAAAEQTSLGAPVAANIDGMRAWILSPAELSAFQQRLKTASDASLIGKPRAQTANGARARMFVGNSVLVAGNNVPIGLTADFVPRIVHNSVKLMIAVASTEAITPPSGNRTAVKTNFAAVCRALIPNVGGLVVAGDNAKDADGKSYWLIVSPTALDARGKPLKP